MAVKCEDCPLRKQPLFTPFKTDDVRFMQRFKVGEMSIDAGTPLLLEGNSSAQLFTVLRGMGLRYKTLENGDRQVINLVYPGDFLGLQAALMQEMQHTVEATTEMTLCVFDRSAFYDFFVSNPSRAFDVTWLAAVEEHFLGASLATVGQRDALSAIAWAVVTVFERAQMVGLAKGMTIPFPYRQQDLADALGLSLVHTNKTFAKLRERQLVSWHDGVLVVNDPQSLRDIAGITESEIRKRPLM